MEKVNHANYMMQLGDYKFSVSTAAFNKLQYDTSYNWQMPESPTDTKNAKQQYLGVKKTTLNIEGVIFPQLVEDGLKQMDKMRDEAKKGEPLTLGYVEESGKDSPSVGRVLGKYVILGIKETRTLFFNDGIPREIEFSLELEKYDD